MEAVEVWMRNETKVAIPKVDVISETRPYFNLTPIANNGDINGCQDLSLFFQFDPSCKHILCKVTF